MTSIYVDFMHLIIKLKKFMHSLMLFSYKIRSPCHTRNNVNSNNSFTFLDECIWYFLIRYIENNLNFVKAALECPIIFLLKGFIDFYGAKSPENVFTAYFLFATYVTCPFYGINKGESSTMHIRSSICIIFIN